MKPLTTDSDAGWRRELAVLDPLAARLPASVDAARKLRSHGRTTAAIEAYHGASGLNAGNPAIPRELSALLASSGRREEARRVLSEACMLEAERLGVAAGDRAEVAAYLVAREFGSEIPPRAPRAYVRAVFDGAAKQFDQHLVGRLGYCAPQLLAAAVQQWIGGELRVLDAGCGTGLAAQLLRPLARGLDGVDLSPGMLDKARALGLYDRLTAGELDESLAGAGPYDLIFAADVFTYIGDLESVAAGCRGAMTVGGLLSFTVEEATSGDYFLGVSGRYRHSPAYLRRVLAAASFRVLAVEEAVMRREAGKPVASLVVAAGVV